RTTASRVRPITNTTIAIQETRMSEHENNELRPEDNADGVDRRGFLTCMAGAGTGAFFLMQGGVLKSYSLSRMPRLDGPSAGGLSFVQINDRHMGVKQAANTRRLGQAND